MALLRRIFCRRDLDIDVRCFLESDYRLDGKSLLGGANLLTLLPLCIPNRHQLHDNQLLDNLESRVNAPADQEENNSVSSAARCSSPVSSGPDVGSPRGSDIPSKRAEDSPSMSLLRKRVEFRTKVLDRAQDMSILCSQGDSANDINTKLRQVLEFALP
jgi:hypothetical protein